MARRNIGIGGTAAQSKSNQVFKDLQSRILDGTLLAGERLPTFEAMGDEFGVSRTVLQAAIGRLKEDGFIRSVDRQGLYVSEQLPHLHRYGIVFDAKPEDGLGWSRICQAIVQETNRLAREDETLRFVLYKGLADATTGPALCEQICDDAERHRLAGLILLPNTYDAIFGGLKERGIDVPVATVFAPEGWGFPSNVTSERAMFYRKALQRLAEQGRTRVAIIYMAGTATGVEQFAAFQAAGLKVHDPWLQFVGRSHPEAAERLVSLLFDGPEDKRPDGLVVADDNLIEHVSVGLARTGIRVGEDLSIVAHTNWPWPYSSILPMDRLGFSARDLLRLAVETCRTIQEGGAVPPDQYVPALFEWELPAEMAQGAGRLLA